VLNLLVLCSMGLFLQACGRDSITGPSWTSIPGASISPAEVTMGEGDEVEFSIVNAPPGVYTWSLGSTRDNIEMDWRLNDGKFTLIVVRVFRRGAVLDLVATPDGGRSRITSVITLR
jgi:hypothetical protein